MTRRRPLRHLTFVLGAAITALLLATAALDDADRRFLRGLGWREEP